MKRGIPKRAALSLYIVITVALLTVGALGLFNWLAVNNDTRVSVNRDVVTHSVDTPSEADITEQCDAFRAADDRPEWIHIPSVGIEGCIQQVGIDQHGAMAVPPNIYLAGWFTESAVPGESGISVIDGHVLGQYNDAIFAHLEHVSSGEMIEVEMGDGSTVAYQVETVDIVDVDQAMEKVYEPLEGVAAQLSLITCAGTYDAQSNTYDQRVVVRAAIN